MSPPKRSRKKSTRTSATSYKTPSIKSGDVTRTWDDDRYEGIQIPARSKTDSRSVVIGLVIDRLLSIDSNAVRSISIETTGPTIKKDEILRICITDGKGEVLLDSLVKPTFRKRWPKAQETHGIDPGDVKESPTLAELSDRLDAVLLGSSLVIGYGSLDHDLQLINETYSTPEWLILDVAQFYRHQHYTSCSLSHALEKLGIDGDIGDARGRATNTAHLYRALIEECCEREKAAKKRVEEALEAGRAEGVVAEAEVSQDTPSAGKMMLTMTSIVVLASVFLRLAAAFLRFLSS